MEPSVSDELLRGEELHQRLQILRFGFFSETTVQICIKVSHQGHFAVAVGQQCCFTIKILSIFSCFLGPKINNQRSMNLPPFYIALSNSIKGRRCCCCWALTNSLFQYFIICCKILRDGKFILCPSRAKYTIKSHI